MSQGLTHNVYQDFAFNGKFQPSVAYKSVACKKKRLLFEIKLGRLKM